MPGVLHEIIVSLFTTRPQLAVELWHASGQPPLPKYDGLQGGKLNLAQATTAAYDADEATTLTLDGEPQMALIVEVQLDTDDDKLFSWPSYVASARFKKRCEAAVLVIALTDRVARWARQPIHMGGGNMFHPIVIGPEQTPIVTDPELAVHNPELMLLSTIVHGKGAHGSEIAGAAAAVVRTLDEDKYDLYTDMVLARLSRIAKEVFSHMLRNLKITEPFSEEYKQAFEAAKLQAAREAELRKARETLKKLMRLKFQSLSADHEAFIDAAELTTLDRALERILVAETPGAVLS
ncbi:MAG: hypothetical protein ACE366_19040 [Bradymonadia bacterium]